MIGLFKIDATIYDSNPFHCDETSFNHRRNIQADLPWQKTDEYCSYYNFVIGTSAQLRINRNFRMLKAPTEGKTRATDKLGVRFSST
mmetsp:Transcript_7799/g.30886  ORF Transcript_7799/g.30886 Transcript_7799/m.30886 type:complete len:87 (+) Transcript_7799:2214-2474(+)